MIAKDCDSTILQYRDIIINQEQGQEEKENAGAGREAGAGGAANGEGERGVRRIGTTVRRARSTRKWGSKRGRWRSRGEESQTMARGKRTRMRRTEENDGEEDNAEKSEGARQRGELKNIFLFFIIVNATRIPPGPVTCHGLVACGE